MYSVKELTFKQIHKVWSECLWKTRTSPIKEVSSMKFLGGYDMNVYNQIPLFVGIFYENNIVGVNSGHIVNEFEYRSRGLWIAEPHRRNGLTYFLFEKIFEHAKNNNIAIVWSLPKVSAVDVYIKNGFTISSNIVTEFEMGPHYYVSASV